MKQVKIKLPLRALTLASGLLLTVSSFAQSNAIKGHVKDASGEPIMGATITVNGKAVGMTLRQQPSMVLVLLMVSLSSPPRRDVLVRDLPLPIMVMLPCQPSRRNMK